jgi:hypothetical protein
VTGAREEPRDETADASRAYDANAHGAKVRV